MRAYRLRMLSFLVRSSNVTLSSFVTKNMFLLDYPHSSMFARLPHYIVQNLRFLSGFPWSREVRNISLESLAAYLCPLIILSGYLVASSNHFTAMPR
ncbi:hypothetical protein RRG08_020478 [Elysia crispata]|uniref:Uncharacterized protein n=1 Tax=Elysia crispata TaxID=231223 RepID=A0AAE1ABG0_9GAST|nr:hypothetical protein RRG08_020478 [Elysia crispata]